MTTMVKQVACKATTFIIAMLASLLSFAQEKGIDVDINVKKESEWYQQPWVWVVGAAVFILLLAAVLKGSGSKAKE